MLSDACGLCCCGCIHPSVVTHAVNYWCVWVVVTLTTESCSRMLYGPSCCVHSLSPRIFDISPAPVAFSFFFVYWGYRQGYTCLRRDHIFVNTHERFLLAFINFKLLFLILCVSHRNEKHENMSAIWSTFNQYSDVFYETPMQILLTVTNSPQICDLNFELS